MLRCFQKHWLRVWGCFSLALALLAGAEVGLGLLSAASDDLGLLLLCFSPDSQGLEVARKFTWASSLHLASTNFLLGSGTVPRGSEIVLPPVQLSIRQRGSLWGRRERGDEGTKDKGVWPRSPPSCQAAHCEPCGLWGWASQMGRRRGGGARTPVMETGLCLLWFCCSPHARALVSDGSLSRVHPASPPLL